MHIRFKNYFFLCGIIIVALLSACGGRTTASPSGGKTGVIGDPSSCDPMKNMCGKGGYCDEVSHKCEKAVVCEIPNKPCANGLTCDGGECVRPVSCPAGLCPDGQICQSGKCFKGTSCSSSTQCKAGVERCFNNVCIDITGKTDLCAANALTCGPKEKCEDNTCKPDCASPCGGVCCDGSDVCYKDTCVAPCAADTVRCGSANSSVCCGGTDTDGNPLACIDNQCLPTSAYTCDNTDTFCPITRYCANFPNASGGYDNKCVKFKDNPALCLLPTVDTFNLVEKLHYETPSILPDYNQSIRIALVADVTGGSAHQPDGIPDGKPDIIVNTYKSYSNEGVLRIISGTAGSRGPTDVTEYWESTQHESPTGDEFFVHSEHTPAIGDLDGDGRPDIVTQKIDGHLIAIKGNGTKIWESSIPFPMSWGTLSIADLDHDGHPEVLYMNSVINGQTGEVICDNIEPNLTLTAADVDETGNMEIISAAHIYSYDPNSTSKCTLKTSLSSGDGDYSAIADIYPENPGPEIALISGGYLYIYDNKGNSLVEPPYKLPGSSAGPPTLGDFDGDERLEVAFADQTAYVIVKPLYDSNSTPAATIKELWQKPTQDRSSGVTGSSIFDFDGDGKAEALYFDEIYLRIYNGENGDEKARIENSSFTDIEYPLVADVDADGHADIVTVGNNLPSGPPRQTYGVRVYTDAQNRWVPTRKIWNQHTYHYTNVNDDGTIPSNEKPHWKQPWSNTFRQNVQKDNNRLASDLTGHFNSIYNKNCSDQSTRSIAYTIRNDGSKVVPAGKAVAIVEVREAGTGTYQEVHRFVSSADLNPGTKIEDSFTFDPAAHSLTGKPLDIRLVVNPDNDVIECRDDNNIIEKLNTSLTPPDLFPNLLSGGFSCNGSGTSKEAKITFELFNQGNTTVAAKSVLVKIELKVSGTTQTFIEQVINKKDIGPNLSEEITVSIPLSSAPDNKSFDVNIVVDPYEKINECNESNNESAMTSALFCYTLG